MSVVVVWKKCVLGLYCDGKWMTVVDIGAKKKVVERER